MSLHNDVLQQIRVAIDELMGATCVSPTTVALSVFEFFKSGHDCEAHVGYASIEHLKHMARDELAGRYSPSSRAEQAARRQDDLFSDLLQDRYPTPVPRGAEPQYKRREFLSIAELDWNIAHIERCGRALLQHADALRAYRDQRPADAA
jgi:hypothetical protein